MNSEQLMFIKELRDKKVSWKKMPDLFNAEFGTDKSFDAIRNAFRRSDFYKTAEKPETKGEKIQRLKIEQSKPKKRVVKQYENNRVLCISDMHQPYTHPDNNAFLAAIKKKYKPDRIICLGDEIDSHGLSFHNSDADLFSAGHELQQSIEALQPVYEMFPNMELVSSNHGDMVYRKGKHHGIPRKYLRDYGEVLEAPKGWTWHKDLVIPLPNRQSVYFHHGLSKNGLKLALSLGMAVVQGHFHTEFNIQYTASPEKLFWSMQVGCMIDDDALAFEYNKTTMGRPILGHGIIIDGHPKLLPMVLLPGGRWNRVVY